MSGDLSGVLQQPPLFASEAEESTALFLTNAECEKRYTGAQAERLRWKRELILLAIGQGAPVSVVAATAEVSTRTVEQLVCSHSEKVAEHQKSFGRQLLGKAARWAALAQMREGGAKFSELVIGMGIAAQRGSELLASSGMGEEVEGNVLQIEAAPEGVMDRVKQLLGTMNVSSDAADPSVGVATANRGGTDGVDAVSGVEGVNGVDGEGVGKFDVVGAAGGEGEAMTSGDLASSVAPAKRRKAKGAGGGSGLARAGQNAMCPALRGDLAKGSPLSEE